jgi:zinc protease
VKVKRFKYPNGLTVLLEESYAAPVVALQAWVKVGSADETDALSGIAHLHEHMLFKGTRTRGVGEIARAIEASGGEINAWTSLEQTVYHVVVAQDEVGTGMDVLSDALRNTVFDAEELAREQEVVVEEILRALDSPGRRLSYALFNAAYETHTYRRPVLGTADTVRSFSRDTLVGFYQQYYRPENVTLVAVGAVSEETLQKHVEQYWASWRVPGVLQRPQRGVEKRLEKPRVKVLREDVKEASLAVAWPIPALNHADTAALDALSLVLGQGDSSRLYHHVQRCLGLANSVYAYAYTPEDPGLFVLGASLPVENIQATLQVLLDETMRLTQRHVTQAELDKAKIQIASDASYQKETVEGQARKLGFFEVSLGDYAAEETYMRMVEALTVQQLQTVAHRYFSQPPVVVVQGPEGVYELSVEEVLNMHRQACAVAAPVHAAPVQGVIKETLPCGTTVLVKSEEGPVVSMRMAALGGQRNATAATAGWDALLGSVWGLATQHADAASFAQQTAMLAGHIGAFSGRNSLGMKGDFIAQKASQGLDLFLQAWLHPRLSEDDFSREKSILLERIKNREDNPAGVAFDLFTQTLFPSHPYGLKMSGSYESVQGCEKHHLEQMLANHVLPSQCVLAVVGPVDVDEVLACVQEAAQNVHGELVQHPAPACDAPPSQPRKAHVALQKKQSHVMVGSMGTTLFHPDRFALDVMCTVLSGQSGRLFLDLRDKQSLAYSIGMSHLEGLDPGYIVVHMGTAPEKVEQALEGVHAHLHQLRETLVSDEECARAQRYLVGTHAIELQKAGSRAMLMALSERYGQGFLEHTHYAKNIQQVTAQDIQRVAQQYLQPNQLITTLVGV